MNLVNRYVKYVGRIDPRDYDKDVDYSSEIIDESN
jgi:hypothetical protein